MSLVGLGAKKQNNVTNVVLVNNTAKTIDLSPGAGIRWLVLNARQVNGDNVNRNVNMTHIIGSFTLKQMIQNNSLATGEPQHYPSLAHASGQETAGVWNPIIVEGAEFIRSVWAAGGASAGFDDADGLVLEVLEMAI